MTPLQKSFLIGATNRIQPHLRQGEEFQKILKEALKEAEEVYNHAMRKWRMQQTVIDPVSGRIKASFRLFSRNIFSNFVEKCLKPALEKSQETVSWIDY